MSGVNRMYRGSIRDRRPTESGSLLCRCVSTSLVILCSGSFNGVAFGLAMFGWPGPVHRCSDISAKTRLG